MQNRAFSAWFEHYQHSALELNERRLVVLIGDEGWASSLLQPVVHKAACSATKNQICLIYGQSKMFQPNVSKQRFRDKLGSESNFVVFNALEDKLATLSIDAFAVLSGTLVAGGVFFLLLKDKSSSTQSYFYRRFFQLLSTYSSHCLIEQSLEDPSYKVTQPFIDDSAKLVEKFAPCFAHHCKTQEQLTAVEAVIKVVKGKRNQPLVLTADRGRGKSSALAIACAKLLKHANKDNPLRLVITAPEIASLAIFFDRLAQSLPCGVLEHGKFITALGSVEFIAIDALLKQPPSASLVLVDEAAAIPIYLLEQLLDKYSRLVFSSTIHGYEGAGRGFTLKFQQTLKQKYSQWVNLHIHEPIRWRAGDPLEQLVFESCLLNAELPKLAMLPQTLSPSRLKFRQFTALELIKHESLFKQLFGVLVTAHYQTKPSDVQMLLDNHQVQLVCLLSESEAEQQVVAVALLINEGRLYENSIDADDIKAVTQSTRRLKNNFIPQSLLTHCGIEYAFNYQYLRVMRIAVHPQLQQQGIGTHFMQEISGFASHQGADFLASSFGATASLLSFWLTNDFSLARIGFNKDKASGEQSALVLKPLTEQASNALVDINTEFYRSFDYLLQDEYKYLSAQLVALVLQKCPATSLALLTDRDLANIEAFSQGHRQFSSCAFSLHLWLTQLLTQQSTIEDDALFVLISRIMQKHSISNVCSAYGFTGKKALEQYLQSEIRMRLRH
ncbi:GNAT family N-acetyltransferase [Colwellia sp. KU-HH00111]|uniref:tRNA(Met) cytidine acetyltransferase TmcA n=1 Tax=Colwellia sp. KU-HH00111 TaxID=3127652 RepID=UPI00310733B4